MSPSRPVTDLFQNRRFRGRLLDRLQDITLAKTAGGRVYLNVRFSGQRPPETWLAALTCAIDAPDTPFIGRVDRVIPSEDDLAILCSGRCAALDNADGYLPAGTAVTLLDSGVGERRTFRVLMD